MQVPRSVVSMDEAAARVEAAVKAKLVASYAALVEATDVAVEALVYIALHGRREEARVAAAREILDRSGLTPEIRVSIDTSASDRDMRMSELRRRLDSMKTGLSTPLELDAVEADEAG
jgi:hypothetical protein